MIVLIGDPDRDDCSSMIQIGFDPARESCSHLARRNLSSLQAAWRTARKLLAMGGAMATASAAELSREFGAIASPAGLGSCGSFSGSN